MTLDGLEKVIQDKYHRNSKGKIENHYRAKTKVNLIRYADDCAPRMCRYVIQKMMEGSSKLLYRQRFQTTLSCFSKKLR
ncbi:hypothetical protein [Clostridium sp. DL-VIII]|uniref:hypothetical protein n=1 Tax=Clostridium sp. DL-VIII TaxID=641107 RepID=UPI001FA771EC|nr:hypothetical protein [Clostridium sp. DL-VIII]